MFAWTVVDCLPGVWFTLIAAVSVAVLGRWYDRPGWRVLVIAASLIAVLFGDVLVGGKLLLPLDNLRGQAPFRQLQPTEPHGNILQGDPLRLVAPALYQVRGALEDGRWPLWREHEGAGMPLAADPQAQALQPLAWMALAVSAASAPAILAALRVWLALLFMFLWLRRLGARESAATAGAVTFALGGFLQHWLTWPLANTAVWLPIALYALARMDHQLRGEATQMDGEPSGPARIDRPDEGSVKRRDVVLLGVALVGLILAGHPETIVLAFAVLAVDLTARLSRRGIAAGKNGDRNGQSTDGETDKRSGKVTRTHRRRLARTVFATSLVAAAISAPVILPTLDYLPQTLRWERTVLGLETPGPGGPTDAGASPATRVVQIAAPNAFGNNRFVHYWGRNNINEDASGFVGTTALLLVLTSAIARWRRPWRFPRAVQPVLRHESLALAGIVVIGLLLALPAGVSGRLALVGNLVFAVVATAEVERFVRGGSKRWAVVLAALTLVVIHLWAYRTFASPADPPTLDILRRGWVHWHIRFLAVGAVILLVGQLRWFGRFQRLGAWALGLLIAAELILAHAPIHPPMPKRLLFPQTPSLRLLANETVTDPGVRFVGVGTAMPPNLASIYGLSDARVFNPMAPAAYLAVLAPILDGWNGEVPSVAARDHPILDLLGVRWLLIEAELGCPARLVPILGDPDALLCRTSGALGRLFFPSAVRRSSQPRRDLWTDFDPRTGSLVESATLSVAPWAAQNARAHGAGGESRPTIDWPSATPERLTARTHLDQPRWLASSIVQDGGWRLLVDGRRVPTSITNGAFVGAWLDPQGSSEWSEHELTLIYRPRGWLLGWLLAAVALATAASRLSRRPALAQRPRASDSA